MEKFPDRSRNIFFMRVFFRIFELQLLILYNVLWKNERNLLIFFSDFTKIPRPTKSYDHGGAVYALLTTLIVMNTKVSTSLTELGPQCATVWCKFIKKRIIFNYPSSRIYSLLNLGEFFKEREKNDDFALVYKSNIVQWYQKQWLWIST